MNEEIRERVIRFRVNEKEYAEIQDRAVGNVSTWIRNLALDQKPKRKPKPVNFELLKELNRIGVNLNQVAKKLNQIQSLSTQDRADLLIIFLGIDEELKELRAKYDS